MLDVEVTNTGSAYFSPAQWYPFPVGSVTLGLWPGPTGERELELDRITLPARSHRATRQSALRIPREAAQGRDAIGLDLVREGIFWFAEAGSAPLVVPIGS